MGLMGLFSDATALLVQARTRRVARASADLFAGTDLDDPDSWRVATRHGFVRCDVYRPPGTRRPPVYVHFHGGAFLMRNPRMDDFFARFLVAETGVAVVNVDYDVAPRHRYPIAHQQAHDVVRWLTQHGAESDLDGSRLAVGGFSTGGNLAASVCLQARDAGTPMPALQLLGVPFLDVSSSIKPAVVENSQIGPGILRLAHASYFKDEWSRRDPYASPLLSDDVHHLAPACIVTAEYDALRAEGDAYAARLAESGVDVRHHVVRDCDHHVLEGDRQRARRVLDLVAGELAEKVA